MSAKREDLTREAWLQAGQALLRDEGLRALRLKRLTEALDISTGSFYHHFKDFDAFLGQLADYFSGEQLTGNLARIRAASADPSERIRIASELAVAGELPRLALAMRAWARSDPRARASVRRLDQALLAFFTECLKGLGFEGPDAVTRAFLLISSATSEIEPPPGLELGEASRQRVLAVICGR
jgi:AcrR family transcriptional regulator